MTQSMGRAVPCMLLLLLVSSVSSALPCADYHNLEMIVELATTCFAACPEVCSPLSEAVALSLSGGDPLPVVCATQDIFSCITGTGNRNICGEMLQTANSMGIAVPRTTEAMQAMCRASANQTDTNQTDTNTTTTTTAVNQTDTTTTTTPQISRAFSIASGAGVWVLLVVAAAACRGSGLDSR